MLKGYFIQYKFKLPPSIRHSSYTYQKLFRALYGYTQDVCKSNGKTYKYHRRGVLSDTPYLRPGKNCVVISPDVFQKLIEFFKTGKNPAHKWNVKGEWNAVYYMNEKDVDEGLVISSLENLLSRKYISTPSGDTTKLFNEMENKAGKQNLDRAYKELLLQEAQPIIDNTWFKGVYQKSPTLKKFHTLYKALKY